MPSEKQRQGTLCYEHTWPPHLERLEHRLQQREQEGRVVRVAQVPQSIDDARDLADQVVTCSGHVIRWRDLADDTWREVRPRDVDARMHAPHLADDKHEEEVA